MVMQLVHVPVEKAPMKSTVHPVVPSVFKNEEQADLVEHG